MNTTATPGNAKRLSVHDHAIETLNGKRCVMLAGKGDEGASLAKIDVCDYAHGREPVDELLKEDAWGDATDKDLCVLRIDRSPLCIELVDNNVISLTFVTGALISKQDELGLVARTVLGVCAGETNRATKAEDALHDVEGTGAFCDGREADKRILGAAAGAADDTNVGDHKGVDIDAAEGVAGEMVHGEAKDVLEVLLCRVRREIRDKEREHVLCL